MVNKSQPPVLSLSLEQREQFLKEGVLVVENVLSKDQVEEALDGLQNTLKKHGVHVPLVVEDEESARAFQNLSSTNGSGGVLDIFYEKWKMKVASNETLFQITTQLWDAAYCQGGDATDESIWWHPYGHFDSHRGYMYIDRVCYRLPTKLGNQLGERINGNKRKKQRAIQRSLTPHLDCCPETRFQNTKKWRPIQCFVSLTDNLEANTGGFEAAKGFHCDFEAWAKNRRPTMIVQNNDNNKTEKAIPAACVGEYTHIRPKEDYEVMKRVCHIPISAGSAVFWDNRIPHSNAYRHTGDTPRSVVYCSFLPDIELNRQYVKRQLIDFNSRRPVTDQWNHITETRKEEIIDSNDHDALSTLGRKLMGIDPW